MRRALLFLCAVLMAPAAWAQQQAKATFVTAYDLDATDYTYCVTTGKNGDPYGPPRTGQTVVETTSSSATVTAVTAGTNPFEFVAVGDVLLFKLDGLTTSIRYVASRTDADEITVDAAIDLDNSAGDDGTGTGFSFSWYDVACGTAATDGWIGVSGWRFKKVTTYIEQMVVTGGIDVRWECRDQTLDSQVIQVYPASGANNYTAAGITSGTSVVIEEPWDQCRIGYKIGSADDGDDLTTNKEIIHAYLEVWK